jgi:septal ring-binding cell division protein DamX
MINRSIIRSGFLFITLLLGACQTVQSPKIIQNTDPLQQGKQNFKVGHYPQAYQELKPLAEQGNAEAEYALGYMNYYGLGVPVDQKQARYWTQQAAAQGHPAAKQAMIEFDKQFARATPKSSSPTMEKTNTPHLIPAQGSTSALIGQDIQRLQRLQNDHYVVQLLGGHDYPALLQVTRDDGLANTLILHRYLQNQDWYTLVIGDYLSRDAAMQAAQALQERDPNLQPWVRQVGPLKQTIA